MDIIPQNPTATKQCIKCKQVKPLTDYYKHSSTRDRLSHDCKECVKARMRVPHTKRGLTLEAHFARYVRKTDGCWLWTGGIRRGYGTLSHNNKNLFAHRVSYILVHGPVPEGLELDHLCRNKLCVNPEHLEAVPHRVNTLRGESPLAKQARQTHCKHGHPLTGYNPIIRPNGGRKCRECKNRWARERKQRMNAAGRGDRDARQGARRPYL